MIQRETFKLLDELSVHSFFKKNKIFLVGGTAIALHSQHRTSYDLDFSLQKLNKLPDLSFLENFGAEKIEFDNFTKESIENEGGDINEMHQRFLINNIKVEFFCPYDNSEKEILKYDKDKIMRNNIHVASLNALFKLKTLTLFDRNKIRDLYDVVFLMKNYNFTAKTIIEIIQKYKYNNMFSTTDSIKLMDTILKDRQPDMDDLDFEGVHNAAMPFKDYESLKDHLRKKIASHTNIGKVLNGTL